MGNTPLESCIAALECGSSPRTWGTQRQVEHRRQHLRFIPTHVGNTHRQDGQHRLLAVHPHARGEHQSNPLRSDSLFGSSPRTWGTLPFLSCLFRIRAVHPHARGEHWCSTWADHGPAGSSPRTWGTPSRRHRSREGRRFIPTHVGNTPQPKCATSWTPVHPHARGEHPAARGSGPRAGRFIPTHVGNTWPAKLLS